jgi:hypothetical protein
MATVAPTKSLTKKVTWRSNNPRVATVRNGLVTAKKAGKATIIARTANGKTARFTITVRRAGGREQSIVPRSDDPEKAAILLPEPESKPQPKPVLVENHQ